jgi:hypothetical protein
MPYESKVVASIIDIPASTSIKALIGNKVKDKSHTIKAYSQ